MFGGFEVVVCVRFCGMEFGRVALVCWYDSVALVRWVGDRDTLSFAGL